MDVKISPIDIMTKMDPEGRLYIPSALRKRLGLTPGDEFEVFMTGDGGLLFRRSGTVGMRE